MTQNKFMAMAIEEAKKGLKIGEIPLDALSLTWKIKF